MVQTRSFEEVTRHRGRNSVADIAGIAEDPRRIKRHRRELVGWPKCLDTPRAPHPLPARRPSWRRNC
jgi:hypothetical protein